jgi:single-strand DNA-binding protein
MLDFASTAATVPQRPRCESRADGDVGTVASEGAPAPQSGELMNETTITLVGNAVSDVQLRATKDGAAWATFRMASNPRRFDRETARWIDGEPLFVTVVCWRALAENVAESLTIGDPVVVTGRVRWAEWEREGHKYSALEVDAQAIGHDLARGRSTFTRVRRDAADRALAAAGLAASDEQAHQPDGTAETAA